MNKKEVLELKRLYKKEECHVNRIAGCYIDAEGTIKMTFNENFLNMEDTEFFKYLEIFKKGLTGVIGKNIRTFDFPAEAEESGGMQDFLLKLRDTHLKNDDLLMRFYEKVRESYTQVQNYLILVMNDAYDVISKHQDGSKNYDESEEVFDYLTCYVIPVRLESAGMAFDEAQGKFVHKERRWCLDVPVCTLLFPSFEDRSSDIHKIMTNLKKADSVYNEFLEDLLGITHTPSPVEQKEGFQTAIEQTIKDCTNRVEIVKAIHETIHEKIEENESPTAVQFSTEQIKDILTESGMEDDKAENLCRGLKSNLGDKPLEAINIIDTSILEVKTPDVVIKVRPDKSHMVESKVIDGHKCLVINFENDNEIEVNGISMQK